MTCPTQPSWTTSRGGSSSRSRARGTTTGAPTRARADTAPLNPPHSTRPLKPPGPHTTIRTRRNPPSSRAGATGFFQIRPRVGHGGVIPSSACLHHHPLLTTASSVSAPFFNSPISFFFALSALFLSLLLSPLFPCATPSTCFSLSFCFPSDVHFRSFSFVLFAFSVCHNVS